MSYNGTNYYFVKDLFGNVYQVLHQDGTRVAEYEYDAWGNCEIKYNPISLDNVSKNNIANVNPFRYRGYYYDVESDLYYLQSRYYSPELCRFISPDSYDLLPTLAESGDLNLYAYCSNNPVMNIDPTGEMPEWLSTTLKIVGGVAIIAGCVVGSIFTGGALSVILTGAAVGAIAGGLSAGISTAVSGGDIHDFGSTFLMSTITGAVSGAVCASPLGIWAQAGINAGISALTYVGTQLMNNSAITFGGIASSAFFGFVSGAIGGNGWMQNVGVKAFVDSGAKGFIKNIVSNVGLSSLIKIGAPALGLGGIASGIYGKYVSIQFNPNGNFWGW